MALLLLRKYKGLMTKGIKIIIPATLGLGLVLYLLLVWPPRDSTVGHIGTTDFSFSLHSDKKVFVGQSMRIYLERFSDKCSVAAPVPIMLSKDNDHQLNYANTVKELRANGIVTKPVVRRIGSLGVSFIGAERNAVPCKVGENSIDLQYEVKGAVFPDYNLLRFEYPLTFEFNPLPVQQVRVDFYFLFVPDPVIEPEVYILISDRKIALEQVTSGGNLYRLSTPLPVPERKEARLVASWYPPNE